MNTSKLILLLLVTFLYGCYKDKGNYDYTDINKIVITDEAAKDRIFIFQGDVLNLSPTINQTKQTDDLSYLWFVYNNSSNSTYTMPRDTLARTKDLSIKITGDIFVLGENYKLTVKATDNKTGISSFQLYDLTISNKYGKGWMFLEERGNIGDMSMILPDGSVEKNVYSLLNPTLPLNNPVSITSSPFDVTDDLSNPNKRIYIQMKNDAIELDNLTLTKKFDIGYLFFAKPQIVAPSYIGWTGYLSGTSLYQRMGIAINNGLVHTNMVGGFPGIKKWGEALPNPNGVYNYNILPFIAGGLGYSATYPIVVFDKKYQRFYSVGTNSLTSFPSAASTVFDLNNVGMELLTLDSSNAPDQYNAVMKDGTTPYLLQFRLQTSVADPVATITKKQMNASGIVNATSFASSTSSPHIFYATDNRLYKYETTSNSYNEAYAFAGNETVTKMDYQKVAPETGQQRLVVATWNGTEGKVYFFNISPVGDLGATYTDTFTGFDKIIDFTYKY